MVFKRHIYSIVFNAWKENKNAIIFGMRRTGKTTLLKQLNKEIKNSYYLDWSTVIIATMDDKEFAKELRRLCQKYDVLLFDEVQERPIWDKLLFGLYNEFVDSGICKIVATGSSSLLLKPKELGIDRSKRIYMNTMSFNEYIEFTKKAKNIATFEYFLGRGFPMYADYNFKKLGFHTLYESVVKPIFLEDLQLHYQNLSSGNMIKLLLHLAKYSFGEINEVKLSQATNINRSQIRDYIQILEGANILKRVYRVNEKLKTGKLAKYKVYLNPHFYIWLNEVDFSEITEKKPQAIGHIVEAYWIHQKSIPPHNINDYYYMKDGSNRSKEIDFVTFDQGSNAFKSVHEIKYSSNIKMTDFNFYLMESEKEIIWVKEINDDINVEQKLIYDV